MITISSRLCVVCVRATALWAGVCPHWRNVVWSCGYSFTAWGCLGLFHLIKNKTNVILLCSESALLAGPQRAFSENSIQTQENYLIVGGGVNSCVPLRLGMQSRKLKGASAERKTP